MIRGKENLLPSRCDISDAHVPRMRLKEAKPVPARIEPYIFRGYHEENEIPSFIDCRSDSTILYSREIALADFLEFNLDRS